MAIRSTFDKRNPAAVFLVDDHPLLRDGLAQLINAQPDMRVCGEAVDAGSAINNLLRLRPQLAIVDLSLGGMPGLELVKDIKARLPEVRILVLSMHDESLYAERCIRAGAMGYIMKEEATERILAAIRRVLGGQVYVSERISIALLHQWAGRGTRKQPGAMESLSDRELEIFQLIGQGRSVREMANVLHLSVKTIEAHREHIKDKLGLDSSRALLRYAVNAGLGGNGQ